MEGLEKQPKSGLLPSEVWFSDEAESSERIDQLRLNIEMSLADGLDYFYSNYTHLDLATDGEREFTPEGERVVRLLLDQVGLPYDVMVKSWLAASYNERLKPNEDDALEVAFHRESATFNSLNAVAYSNLGRILEVECTEIGAAKYMHYQQGLANFARFPLQLLVEQYQERDSQKPYGLYVTSSLDPNGFLIKSGNIAESIGNQLPSSHMQRIVEIRGKFDLVRRLLRFKKSYDKEGNNPLRFVVFAAHGEEKFMLVGIKDEAEVKSSKPSIEIIDDIHLLSGGFTRAGISMIEPGCDVVLVACCTGASQGFASVASKALNCRIIAPNNDIYNANIEVGMTDNGKIRLIPTFEGADAMFYNPD